MGVRETGVVMVAVVVGYALSSCTHEVPLYP